MFFRKKPVGSCKYDPRTHGSRVPEKCSPRMVLCLLHGSLLLLARDKREPLGVVGLRVAERAHSVRRGLLPVIVVHALLVM